MKKSKPKIAQKGPYIVDITPGTYHWCACGYSNSQPFCDGSHKGTEFTPIEVKIDKPGRVTWCGCKRSRNAPFCIGDHEELEDSDV